MSFNYKGITEKEIVEQESVWGSVSSEFLNKDSVVYDIGAYRGVTARGFAEIGAEVHAFEGSKINHDYLIENTKDLKNIMCYNVALHTSNYKTKTRFNDCINQEYLLQEITYVRLDDFVSTNKIKDPNLIKMDIEGMESVVMLTCERFIADVKPIWLLSLHENFPGFGLDYPGWVASEQGGYRFDNLFEYYKVYDGNLNEMNELSGSPMECLAEYLLLPRH